jgi:hypothetical protein
MPPEPAAVPLYGLSGQLGVTTLFVPKPAAPGLVGPVGVPPEPPAVLLPKGGDVGLVTCATAIDSLAANQASVKTTRLRYTPKILSYWLSLWLDFSDFYVFAPFLRLCGNHLVYEFSRAD